MTISFTTSSLVDDLTNMADFFVSARDDLKQDMITDLTGMDREISSLCERVQKSTPDVQKDCLPKLTALIDLLNEYEKDLRQFQALEMAQTDQKNGSHNG